MCCIRWNKENNNFQVHTQWLCWWSRKILKYLACQFTQLHSNPRGSCGFFLTLVGPYFQILLSPLNSLKRLFSANVCSVSWHIIHHRINIFPTTFPWWTRLTDIRKDVVYFSFNQQPLSILQTILALLKLFFEVFDYKNFCMVVVQAKIAWKYCTTQK